MKFFVKLISQKKFREIDLPPNTDDDDGGSGGLPIDDPDSVVDGIVRGWGHPPNNS